MEQIPAMRLSERKVQDDERISAFLDRQRIGYLGLADQASTYVVPLNYLWANSKVYFHGADSGRKAEILAQEPNTVCLTLAEDLATLTDPVPAHTDTAFFSVMIFGTVRRVLALDEKREAMQALLDKFVPGYYKQPLAAQHVERYRSSSGIQTAIYCLEPTVITAKENPLDPARAFRP
ncbi:MAG: pyridoxamine 5'-phosphate oxidase family protein [Sporolactobacillus sp.]